jgi:glucose-6-phosphate isomerase
MGETTDEKEARYQVTVTQKDIRDIKKEVADLSNKVNDVHTAIIGSPLAKDGGMVQRLEDCEKEVETVKDKLEAFEKELQERTLKSELYIKIIWGMGGSIAAGLFTSLLYYIFKK